MAQETETEQVLNAEEILENYESDDFLDKMMDLMEMKDDWLCGTGDSSCGELMPISIAPFFAPGEWIINYPPFSLDLGYKQQGFPVVWDGAYGKDWMTTSNWRFYVMPTTTGKVGLGFCMGNYMTNMNASFAAAGVTGVTANCYVIIPPIEDLFCDADEEDNEEKEDLLWWNGLSSHGNVTNQSLLWVGDDNSVFGGTSFKVESYYDFSSWEGFKESLGDGENIALLCRRMS